MTDNAYRIDGVAVSGGFLDGFDFRFSASLNCVIGARGTGKTSLVEFIRYALKLEPRDEAVRKRFDSFIEGNLRGGTITVSVTSGDGLRYQIRRTWNEEPVVMTGEGAPTGRRLTPALFGVDIFSQNEIEAIAGNPREQLRLIDSFDSLRIEQKSQDISSTVAELRSNATELEGCRRRMAALSLEVEERQALEDRLERLAQVSDGTSEDVGRANALRSMREKEKDCADALDKLFGEAAKAVSDFLARIGRGSRSADPSTIGESENIAIVGRLRERYSDFIRGIVDAVTSAVENGEEIKREFDAERAELDMAQQAQEQEYLELIEKADADRSLVAERMATERKLNRILEKARELDELSAQEAALQARREELLALLTRLRNERFALRDAVVRRINDALAPDIRVRVEQYGDTEAYQRELASWLKRTPYALQHRQVAQKIAERYSPRELIRMVRDKKPADLSASLMLNQNQTNAVMAAFGQPEAAFAIETVATPDLAVIRLNDNETYKETERLSTGQKCNAILPIVMLESDRPLVIDQPEDNLDNRFIHRSIVGNLLKVKGKRELILVTHNPNIPVLGNAERILVMSSDGSCGRIAKSGTIDECKNEIVSLLEGGAEAFRRRQQRYGLR